jgi:hypothetical protein
MAASSALWNMKWPRTSSSSAKGAAQPVDGSDVAGLVAPPLELVWETGNGANGNRIVRARRERDGVSRCSSVGDGQEAAA